MVHFEGLGLETTERGVRASHLNLAHGESERPVAVVVADDLELVFLAHVENRGRL